MAIINSAYYTYMESPLGRLYIAGSISGVFRVDFNTKSETRFRKSIIDDYQTSITKSALPFRSICKQLQEYFIGKRTPFKCKLDISRGTKFQQKVWNALRKIPYGETQSYQWIAEQIGNPNASRAVGQANGNNPIPIIIPCHRVISADGSLGGFSGGLKNKKILLKLEGADF